MSNFTTAKSADLYVVLEDGYGFDTHITTTAEVVSFPKSICVAMTISAGSAPTGTMDVEGSLDGVNFFSLQALIGGSVKAFSDNGTYALNYTGLAIRWARVHVVRTSGSGSVHITLSVV